MRILGLLHSKLSTCPGLCSYVTSLRCCDVNCFDKMSVASEVLQRTGMTEELGLCEDQKMTSLNHKAHVKSPVYSLVHNRKCLLVNTHLNAVIYSSCFWVQLGVLPVIALL